MATVAAVYDLSRQARRPEEVLAELRPVRDASKPRPRARNKRVWASVEKTSVEVTSEVFEEASRRDPERRRRWVVLVDGDPHQIARIRAEAILRLRSLRSGGDFDDYWPFHLEAEHARNHASRYANPTAPTLRLIQGGASS